MSAAPQVAPVLWAQRPKWLFVTVPVIDIVPDSVSVRLALTNPPKEESTPISGQVANHMEVSFATKGGAEYKESLPLFGYVFQFGHGPSGPGDANERASRFAVTGRSLQLRLAKTQECSGAYWPRLTQQPTKKASLKPDWQRWRDEDDVKAEDEEKEAAEFAKSTLNSQVVAEGITLSGNGDPVKIAQLQQEYLNRHSKKSGVAALDDE
jgi:hypothetical protein